MQAVFMSVCNPTYTRNWPVRTLNFTITVSLFFYFGKGRAKTIHLAINVTFSFLFQASTLDPLNKAVQDQLKILKEKERNHDKKMSRALGVMFGRKV